MRDVLFKNLTSIDHHRRDIFLSESFVDKGVTTKTLKHFIYLIRDHEYVDSPKKLEAWVKRNNQSGPRLKNLAVLKYCDSKSGEERFEVKIEGNIYILREHDIYNVEFTQIFKITRNGELLQGLK